MNLDWFLTQYFLFEVFNSLFISKIFVFFSSREKFAFCYFWCLCYCRLFYEYVFKELRGPTQKRSSSVTRSSAVPDPPTASGQEDLWYGFRSTFFFGARKPEQQCRFVGNRAGGRECFRNAHGQGCVRFFCCGCRQKREKAREKEEGTTALG